jgi:hypothetical protein
MHAATAADHRVESWLHSIFSSVAGTKSSDEEVQADPDDEDEKFKVQKQMMDVQDRLSRLSGSRF